VAAILEVLVNGTITGLCYDLIRTLTLIRMEYVAP